MLFCQQCGGNTEVREIDGRSRPVCVTCAAVTYLDPKLAAGVIVVRDDRMLFGLRGPNSRGAGRWSFPAGFVERGERVEDAAVREAREEIGLEVTLGPLLGLFSETGDAVVLAMFLANEAAGEPFAGDDLVELGWFGVDDLPELAFPRDRSIVELWKSQRR